MKLYTCNACRYTFPAETLPDRCPDCGKATANVKVCIGGKNILRSVPAIRESTDTEAAEYERIKKEIEKELAAEEEQKNIAASKIDYTIRYITLLLQHKLQQDEHNMALILGYSFLTLPSDYIKGFILSVLEPDQADRFGGTPASSLPDRYTECRRRFSSELQTERRSLGDCEYDRLYQSTWEEGTLFVDEESVRVLPTQDNMNPDTPALNFMKYAVCDEPVLCLKTPNLGTVRHIKCKDIAEHPSEEYLAFLRDVYNIM